MIPISLRSILILSSSLSLDLPKGLFPVGVTVKSVESTPTHLTTLPAYLNLLDLIRQIILGERYKL